jgi:hypothetical protein
MGSCVVRRARASWTRLRLAWAAVGGGCPGCLWATLPLPRPSCGATRRVLRGVMSHGGWTVVGATARRHHACAHAPRIRDQGEKKARAFACYAYARRRIDDSHAPSHSPIGVTLSALAPATSSRSSPHVPPWARARRRQLQHASITVPPAFGGSDASGCSDFDGLISTADQDVRGRRAARRRTTGTSRASCA